MYVRIDIVGHTHTVLPHNITTPLRVPLGINNIHLLLSTLTRILLNMTSLNPSIVANSLKHNMNVSLQRYKDNNPSSLKSTSTHRN